MSVKAKLELDTLTDQQVLDLNTLVGTSMGGHAATFTAPNPPLATLAAAGTTMTGLMQQRTVLLQQAQTLTVQIRTARNVVEAGLNGEAAYVEGLVANLEPNAAIAVIKEAGMAVASGSTQHVGAMPKIEGLQATQGDADGEVDLSWNPVKRGLQNYLIEQTEDPAGLTGWAFAKNERKSKTTVTGLTSGKRYWFRVTAEGNAGPGPASDPATKVAP